MSEYNKDLKIDFDQLDLNWRDHSTNYMKWSEKWVNAVAYRDHIKESLEVLKAELDGKYRKELYEIEGKKPTEASITAAITADEEYKTVQQTLLDANEAANLMAAAKVAFEHRKKALEGLTQLWVGGYFSNPNIPSEVKDRYERDNPRYQKEQQAKLGENKRLKKRKVITKKKG